MKTNYQYYGLKLTDVSREQLKRYLLYNNFYVPTEELLLDHCTLLHISQEREHRDLKEKLDYMLSRNMTLNFIAVDAIGATDKAFAFHVLLNKRISCANMAPHITVQVMNGGSPVNSNEITKWVHVNPIFIVTRLVRV